MKNQNRAYLFAFSAILCWSTIATAFKVSLRYTDIITLLLMANGVAVVVLLVILLIRQRVFSSLVLHKRDWARSAMLGFFNPFCYYMVLLVAYDLLPAQEAGTLNYIWPLMLVLLSIPLLKQKISLWSLLAIGISFMGLLIISTRGDLTGLTFTNPLGAAMALLSALFWALYWILNMKDTRDDAVKLFLNFCFGFLYVAVVYLIRGEYSFPSAEAIAGGIYLGIFEMGLTFFLWMKALQYSVTTAKVSNLIYLSPFISLIIIHVVVGEKILMSTIAGLGLIVAGILLQQVLKR